MAIVHERLSRRQSVAQCVSSEIILLLRLFVQVDENRLACEHVLRNKDKCIDYDIKKMRTNRKQSNEPGWFETAERPAAHATRCRRRLPTTTTTQRTSQRGERMLVSSTKTTTRTSATSERHRRDELGVESVRVGRRLRHERQRRIAANNERY